MKIKGSLARGDAWEWNLRSELDFGNKLVIVKPMRDPGAGIKFSFQIS